MSIFASHWKSSSSLDNSSNKSNKSNNRPDPNPSNYEILRYEQIGEYLIIEIKYFDCPNYEGKKILIFGGISIKGLMCQEQIDPHFSDNKNFYSPMARFEPTETGWKYAKQFANLLKRGIII
jgi:hypothetical protein